jgi:DNA mismatch endonuclease (patch repair protein)
MKSKHGFETTIQRSELMSKIKSSNTKPELLLRNELWKLGFRYRLNVSKLKGKPDIFLKKYKVIIFVDGEFWHGYKWAEKKAKIKSNSKYWIKKIEQNIERDIRNNEELKLLGYKVLRFWEHEIKKDLANCIQKIIIQIIKV